MNIRAAWAVLVVLAPGACRAGDRTADGGRDSGPGADAADTGADVGLAPETVQVIADITLGLAVTTALAGPLASDGMMLHFDPMSHLDAVVQARSESGFSGSVVMPSTCAAYSWSGLTSVVTLDGCTLQAIGAPVAGGLSLDVIARPNTRLTVNVAALTAAAAVFDGHVALEIRGIDLVLTPPSIDMDITYQVHGTGRRIVAPGLAVVVAMDGVGLRGDATTTSGGSTSRLTMTDLTWQKGRCLPSSGTMGVTAGGLPMTTLTFLATTPADGAVTVQLEAFPPRMVMLFAPCP